VVLVWCGCGVGVGVVSVWFGRRLSVVCHRTAEVQQQIEQSTTYSHINFSLGTK